MKTEVKTGKKKKEFKPFSVTFTAESLEDARLLYHITNHADIFGLITKDNQYDNSGQYSNKVTNGISSGFNRIESEILNQGFKI